MKDSHTNLEDALEKINAFESQVDEKVLEVEDIRARMTKVAEMF